KTCALLSNSPIKKLSLRHVLRRGRDDEYSRVIRWIWTAMERGLLELHLHSYSSVDLKRELLTSNTLVKLTLSGDYCLGEHLFLPALKSLSLLSLVGLDHPNYCRLIDGYPVLEELFVRDDRSNLPLYGTVVASESIKRLVAFHFCCKSMPMFYNLLNLCIESNKDKGWQVMPLLLKSCPNLHTLAIKVCSVSFRLRASFCPLHTHVNETGLLVSGSCAQSHKWMRRCMRLQP
ncbi:unnamed protein product, partial [Thlaspi arvense]